MARSRTSAVQLLAGRAALLIVAAAVLAANASTATAQYIGLGVPFNNLTESSYERMGVGFDFWLKGAPNQHGVVGLLPNGQLTPNGAVRFTQGGFGSALPPFGGYDPNADATFGFAKTGPSGFALNISLGKGSTRTATNTTPTIVVPNGVPGSVFSGQLSPFVTGVVPVVGGMPAGYYTAPARPTYWISPVEYKLWQLQQEAALDRGQGVASDDELVLSHSSRDSEKPVRALSDPDSSASRAALSVAELTRQREQREAVAEQSRLTQIRELVASAEQAVADRFYGAAREDLRKALRLATPNEREAIQTQLDAVPRR